jgi:hypothetical protein
MWSVQPNAAGPHMKFAGAKITERRGKLSRFMTLASKAKEKRSEVPTRQLWMTQR